MTDKPPTGCWTQVLVFIGSMAGSAVMGYWLTQWLGFAGTLLGFGIAVLWGWELARWGRRHRIRLGIDPRPRLWICPVCHVEHNPHMSFRHRDAHGIPQYRCRHCDYLGSFLNWELGAEYDP